LNETREGFISKFVFKYNNCGINENIYNEDPKTKDLNINMAMVTAMVNVGQGFSQMDGICTTLNMPNICNFLIKSMEPQLSSFYMNNMILEF